MALVLAVFGAMGLDAAHADTNSDGVIDAIDIGTILQAYGDEGLALLSRECDRRVSEGGGPVLPVDFCECMEDLGGAFGFGAEDIQDICDGGGGPGEIPGGGGGGGGGGTTECDDMPTSTAEQCQQFADCVAASDFDQDIEDAENELADLESQMDDHDAHVNTMQTVMNLWTNVVAEDTGIMRWQVRQATEPRVQSLSSANRKTYIWTSATAAVGWFMGGPLGGALVGITAAGGASVTIDGNDAAIAQLQQDMNSGFAEIASASNGLPANQPASVSSAVWARLTASGTGSAARLAQAQANLANARSARSISSAKCAAYE